MSKIGRYMEATGRQERLEIHLEMECELAASRAECARLRSALDAMPHTYECAARYYPPQPCDCPRSALSPDAGRGRPDE